MMPQTNFNKAQKPLAINSNPISTMQANTVEQPLTGRGGGPVQEQSNERDFNAGSLIMESMS